MICDHCIQILDLGNTIINKNVKTIKELKDIMDLASQRISFTLMAPLAEAGVNFDRKKQHPIWNRIE